MQKLLNQNLDIKQTKNFNQQQNQQMKNILIQLPPEVQERIIKEAEKELNKEFGKITPLIIPDQLKELREVLKMVFAKG